MGRGTVQPGRDLDLHVGWDRFEKLILNLVQRVLGLRGVRFRRYGTLGQKQHGIDLAGRDPEGVFVVVQCKDYKSFTKADLREAVAAFTSGGRPFDATHLIVVTSASTEPTQVFDELAALQTKHPELTLDLWGTEQINAYLRRNADVVVRFWTRETATTFCTAAPLPGVPAPPPDRRLQADRILVGPLKTPDVLLNYGRPRTSEVAPPTNPPCSTENWPRSGPRRLQPHDALKPCCQGIRASVRANPLMADGVVVGVDVACRGCGRRRFQASGT